MKYVFLLLLLLPILILSLLKLYADVVRTNDAAASISTDASEQQQGHQVVDPPSRPRLPCQGFYSRLRFDRSGSVIRHMLWHSLHAYQTNTTYCGACGTSQHSPVVKRLLNAMGLLEELPLLGDECLDGVDFLKKLKWPNLGVFRSDAFARWRKRMMGIVQGHIVGGNHSIQEGDSDHGEEWWQQRRPYTDVAHVRRGDLDLGTAARGREKSMYLPNDYYIQLIERYKRPGGRVVVHTEEAYLFTNNSVTRATTEGNDAFLVRNYTVIVGGKEEDAWRDFVDCDVLIGSKSAFTFVSAMFSRGTVLFPNNFISPMPDWILVPTNRSCLTSSCRKILD